MRYLTRLFPSFLLLAGLVAPSSAQSADSNVTRATLDNGLRVVIVRDTLAPVATIEDNYLAGGNETPPGFPGMAHAQEHMAFRGCAGLSADQIAAIYAQLGADQNADTALAVAHQTIYHGPGQTSRLILPVVAHK